MLYLDKYQLLMVIKQKTEKEKEAEQQILERQVECLFDILTEDPVKDPKEARIIEMEHNQSEDPIKDDVRTIKTQEIME